MDETKAFLIGMIAFFVALGTVISFAVHSSRLDGEDRRATRLAAIGECVELDDPMVQLDCVNEVLEDGQ